MNNSNSNRIIIKNKLLAPFSIANSGSIYTTTYIVVSIAEKYFMYTLIFAQVLQ